MRILITGANGFLGTRLAQRLAEEGHEVLAMVRRIQDYPGLKHPKIVLVKGDVVDRKALDANTKDVDQVYHLAALANDWTPDFRDFYRINVQGTVNVLESSKANGVQKIVVTSTAGTIGPPDKDNVYPIDERHIRLSNFFSDYESSKLMAEERILQYAFEGMNVVMVSPTRVFGPGTIDRKNGYLFLIKNWLYGPLVPYPGFKKQLANMVYLDDVVEGHLLAMEKGRSGQKYLLGGSNVTFNDLFQEMERITGKRKTTFAIPLPIMDFVAWMQDLKGKYIRRQPSVTKAWMKKTRFSWPVSSQKAIKELGYAPHSFPEAIQKTVEWMKTEKAAGRI